MRLIRANSVVLFSLVIAQPAFAQSDSSARVGVAVERDSIRPRQLPTIPPAPPKDTTPPSWKNVGTGMLLGAGIGTGLGFAIAFATTRGNYPDHSEDGLVFMYFGVLGGVVGLVVGMVAGAMHR